MGKRTHSLKIWVKVISPVSGRERFESGSADCKAINVHFFIMMMDI